jgi:hypothetical protein
MPRIATPRPPKEYTPFPDIQLDTGWFDFSPEEPEDPKIAQLNANPRESIPDRLEWTLQKRPYLIPGRKFDIDRHKYLVDLYQCAAKEIVVMKSSQAGVSEWLLTYAVHACDQRDATVLYLFPSDRTISDFSTARLGPAIEASDYMKSIVIDGSGKNGQAGSNKIMLKRFRNRFLWFRGATVDPEGNAEQLKSIDADILILDEVDEQDQRAPSIAVKRLGHAREDCGNVLWVSTPTFPDYGIHAEYQDSDRRQWFIRCDFCSQKQPLAIEDVVTEWDELGRPAAWHGQSENDAWVTCRNCGKKLNRLADGEWVAEFPSVERVGFHLNKLFSPYSKPIYIVKNLDTTDDTKKREAWNQDLGLPFVSKGENLTSEDIDACRREYGHGPDFYTSCYMGIDVGSTLHVVIRTQPNFISKETKQLYAGEATWDSVHNLIKIYRPVTIVIDAMPETTESRRLQDAYPRNMVWVAYYPNQPAGSKRDDIAIWNPVERTVMIDRTRALDAMFAGFYGRTSTLPAHARNIREYYNQMRVPLKIKKEIGTTGVEVATYVDKRKADHYAHAENYAYIASICTIRQGWSQGAAS